MGLSPWARGIRSGCHAIAHQDGSIPVGTGNPHGRYHGRYHGGVYPRGHGESSIGCRWSPCHWGLSPWARGIRRRRSRHVGRWGSIPVGTGNPPAWPSRRCTSGVYPRGHGESWPSRSPASSGAGLSPWARGIQVDVQPDPEGSRSIPVGTGNPRRARRRSARRRVYPRGHGESLLPLVRTRFYGGLSPWARGIQISVAWWRGGGGSIPVGTGNPCNRWITSDKGKVYPRGHGESPNHIPPLDEPAGLSPWARGIPERLAAPQAVLGSIPVGTGNPWTACG